MKESPEGRHDLTSRRQYGAADSALKLPRPGRYRIGTADLIALRKAGLSSDLQAERQGIGDGATRRQHSNTLQKSHTRCASVILDNAFV